MSNPDAKHEAEPDAKDAINDRAETLAKQPEKSHMHSKDAATPKTGSATPTPQK